MKFYILCKNEEPNIQKCLKSLLDCGMEVVVLDSGSTDATLDIVAKYPVTLINYQYTNHCAAYNYITSSESDAVCGIFDADMELTPALAEEIREGTNNSEVLISPVEMYIEGLPMKYGSLYPPKPIVFRTGKTYFEAVGHGERLINGLNTYHTKNTLIHNDLKSYKNYIETQLRYADKLINRASMGQLSWRDKLRVNTPIFILITPLYSLLVKRGILCKAGWLYAIDRLIAEAIMYHRSLRESIDRKKRKLDTF
jgi:glycosyltransferase involved in cell wall biosynthesis